MRKLMAAALSFAAATALCHYLLPLPWLVPLGLAAAAVGAAALLRRGRAHPAWSIVSFALAVAFLYNAAYISVVRSTVDSLISDAAIVEAEVLDYAEPTRSRWRIPVRVLGERRCRAMYYGGEELAGLAPGDRLSGTMTVADAASVNDTPLTSFTAKGYFLMLFPADGVTVTEGAPALRYFPKLAARKLAAAVDALYDEERAPFVRAILLGDRSTMSEGEESILSEVGIYHLTAVSGMHCGFLMGMVAFLVGRRRQRLLAVIALPLLWAYVLITGCPASMVRAAVMLTMVLLGPLFGRENDPPTALSFALLILLLVNPYAVAGVGLQLSFGAMAGLLVLTPRIAGVLPSARGVFGRAVIASVSASLGVMALTAPLTALYFGNISLISPLANLLTMPVASLTFGLCLLSAVLGLFLPAVGALPAAAGGLGVRYIMGVAAALAEIPYHSISFVNPYLIYVLLFVLTAFSYCACTGEGRRKYLLALVLSAAMLAGAVYLPIRQRQGSLHMVAVDVGQGASAILSSGGVTALVDCGSSNSYVDAGDRAADTLQTYGYFALDYLILTHYHADHVSGLPVLLARVPVKTILAPVPGEEDTFYPQLCALAEEHGAALRFVTADTDISLGEASLTLISPLGEGGGNEDGLSVLCRVGEYDALITGDMGRSGEKILAAKKELPDLEVLLVGHHGAAGSTSRELLDAVTPEVGIISVGDNSYGHPDPGAMQRMVRRGMTIYRTDKQGNISLVVP